MRLHLKRPLGRKKIAALALAVCAAAASALSLTAGGTPAPLFPAVNSAPVTAYTLEQRQTNRRAGRGDYLRAVMERLQRSDGTFAVRHTYYLPDGTVEAEVKGVGHVAVGTFRLDARGEVLEFVAGPGDKPTTEEQLRSDPNFEREDDVLGQRTLVTRHPGSAESPTYREAHLAPNLRYLVLKSVSVTARGEEVLEPTRLDLGEPDGTLFHEMARYAKSFARFEERIRESERRGDEQLADALRLRLARARK